MVASCWQWPASSRATATATIVRRLPRRSRSHQRWCSRRAVASEAVPVAELDRERERRQGRDTTQATETGDDRGEALLRSRLRDRPVERIPARLCLRDRTVALLEGEQERPRRQTQATQPALVRERPGRSRPDEPVPQEQLREPVAGTHQIRARVLARPDRVPAARSARWPLRRADRRACHRRLCPHSRLDDQHPRLRADRGSRRLAPDRRRRRPLPGSTGRPTLPDGSAADGLMTGQRPEPG